MIHDARALEHRFVPEDLAHREGQIDALATALDPITYGEPGEHTLITGPSGSGKTTLATYVCRKLKRHRLDFRWGSVNCQSDPTPTAALAQLVRRASIDARRPQGTARSYYLDQLRAADGQVVAILDEVNVITDPSLLHALQDIPGVTVIGICIDEDTLLSETDLQPGTRSRLRSMQRLRLDPYSHHELVDILDYRVAHGLDASRVDDAAVDVIADSAAGNARLAITHLRRAAKHVRDHDTRTLTPAVVDAVAEAAQADVRDLHVRSLGTHQRALYAIIRDAGTEGIASSALHDAYEQRVQQPRGRSMRRRYLASLREYDLIAKQGDTSGTIYTPCRTPS